MSAPCGDIINKTNNKIINNDDSYDENEYSNPLLKYTNLLTVIPLNY
ncbi:hypothetical protein DDB_G0268370 [Dictyostelium discoideum AX4]|uniref:Putative uncharacterized protein DDB_G0268370 n=1 Tax=Dictyostelium discoideum TaxID=44689 RepID=Y2167_DICDI|nr:hypothetical protein DDB_G0268370 [Dictyostelium discoideum AX4]Q55G14.1 RecName: Full=Putative uncharacterized protein DDB_G0268370 [Dictyostelium discoideum]EAL73638.1 hypothetical protein DDB_G0268370 [Dictyostelium discoideum AX4]|eukprot:XP_647369.1 hypothetical protein DDB_G0268370 [Dictyostelium discoideum AX4]